MKIYLAGPMRGIKDFNFPAFHEMTSALRLCGHEVFSAAEYEEGVFGKGFNKSETGDLADIERLDWDFRAAFFKDCEYITLEADAVAVLPGWESSKGAKAEVAVARAIGLAVLNAGTLKPIEDPKPHKGIGGAPMRASVLPESAGERKSYPIASGFMDYFPDAICEIARLSHIGNEQHNPGKPLHWDRSKSGDEADTMQRHFLQRGTLDKDGVRHTVKMAWRALALLQKELESK